MLRASGAHERRGPRHNLRITPRATPGGPPPTAPTCNRRGPASGSHHSSPSHFELNRYLPDHGLAEFRAVHLAITAQRYSMIRSDCLSMADATGAVPAAKLCIDGRYVVLKKSAFGNRFSLVRRSEAIAALIESASHGPKQAHHFYDGSSFPRCGFRKKRI